MEADHLEAKLSLVAAPDAKEPPAGAPPIVLTATAIIDGKATTKKIGDLGKVTLAPRPKFTVKLEPANVVVAPGSTTTAWLVLERHDFKDRLQFQVRNLPHGVYVDNLGLNGILIPPGQTKRQVFITARPWVQETTRPFFAVADQASPAITVTVRRPQAIAEKE